MQDIVNNIIAICKLYNLWNYKGHRTENHCKGYKVAKFTTDKSATEYEYIFIS